MRSSAGGALLSDDGTWYLTLHGFRPLVADTGPQPDVAETARAHQAMTLHTLTAGYTLAYLVAEHGTLAQAHHALGQGQAPGRATMTRTYATPAALGAAYPRMLALGWRLARPPRPVLGLAALLDRVFGRRRRLRACWRRNRPRIPENGFPSRGSCLRIPV